MKREQSLGLLSKAAALLPSTGPWLLETIALSLIAACVCDQAMAQCKPENVREIVQRAAIVMRSDWNAFPGFAFVQRDSETSKRVTVTRTYRVFMIDGTDYYMPVAVNDTPYTVEQLAQEHDKLLHEINRRSHETEKERQHRSDRYWKERNQTGTLLEEFVKAFDFILAGEEAINGHLACVLDAKPKLDYRPPNREAKF